MASGAEMRRITASGAEGRKIDQSLEADTCSTGFEADVTFNKAQTGLYHKVPIEELCGKDCSPFSDWVRELRKLAVGKKEAI